VHGILDRVILYILGFVFHKCSMSAVLKWSTSPEWQQVVPTPCQQEQLLKFRQLLLRVQQFTTTSGEMTIFLYDRYPQRNNRHLRVELDTVNTLLLPVQLFHPTHNIGLWSMSAWTLLWMYVNKIGKEAHKKFIIMPVDCAGKSQFTEYRSTKSARNLKGICLKIAG
jgi:hypothetical protein